MVGHYRHEWDLGPTGPGVSAREAMHILQTHPNDIYPFAVIGHNGEKTIELGSTYDLVNTYGPVNNFLIGPDQVRTIAKSDTSYTFVTLYHHHRGGGQTITFKTYERTSTYQNSDGLTEMRTHVYLVQEGTYQNVPFDLKAYLKEYDSRDLWRTFRANIELLARPVFVAFQYIANSGAGIAWGLQAHNLRVALGTTERTEDEANNVFEYVRAEILKMTEENVDKFLPDRRTVWPVWGSPSPGGSGKPAARVSDMHICPMVTGTILHVGGPIAPPGCHNVLVGRKPAARRTDKAICNGPEDIVETSVTGILIGGLPPARMSDMTAHGGRIVQGFPAVLIADAAGGGDEGDGATVMA
jgi:uncharacterized Zn-binding protein involved in type VI secretion